VTVDKVFSRVVIHINQCNKGDIATLTAVPNVPFHGIHSAADIIGVYNN